MAITAASPPAFLNGPAEQDVNVVYDYARFCKESKTRWTPLEIKPVPSGTHLQTNTIYARKTGLLAAFRVVYEGTFTLTKGGGALALPLGWPYSLMRKYRLIVNGQEIQNGSGLDLYVRQQMRTKHHAGTTVLSTVNNTDGTYTVRIMFYIPVEHDALTMAGVIFTETDAVTTSLQIDWGSQAEAFSLSGGAAMAVGTANVRVLQKSYDIPRDIENGKPVLILPRMDLVHSVFSQDMDVASNGPQRWQIDRQPMQLLRLWGGLFNGSSDWVDPAGLPSVALAINGSTTVRNYLPAYTLVEENAENYNGRLAPNQFVFDLQSENANRDSVLPRSVAEMSVDIDLGSTPINVGTAKAHLVQEGLATCAVRAPLNSTQKSK